MVLFAEGTSSDGNRVLPFRSALLGAVEEVASRGDAGSILIQPMAITYTGQHGIPMGRQRRPLVAWYGDLDFMPHIKAFIERGAVDAVVSYRRTGGRKQRYRPQGRNQAVGNRSTPPSGRNAARAPPGAAGGGMSGVYFFGDCG